MNIFTWCDPKYFHFAEALIKSIRVNGNDYNIFIHAMDFSNKYKEDTRDVLSNWNVNWMYSNSKDAIDGIVVKDKFQYYRNSRPRFFYQMLKENTDNLFTIAANGLVMKSLKFIEKDLTSNDFVFLERTKKIKGIKIQNINQANKLILNKKISLSCKELARLVLLGTHGIQNNKQTKKVIKKWMNYVEDTSMINEVYSDMGLFVRALLDIQNKTSYMFNKKTGWDIPREDNPYCDTLMQKGSNIWFAKSRNKWNNPKYLNAVSHYRGIEAP